MAEFVRFLFNPDGVDYALPAIVLWGSAHGYQRDSPSGSGNNRKASLRALRYNYNATVAQTRFPALRFFHTAPTSGASSVAFRRHLGP